MLRYVILALGLCLGATAVQAAGCASPAQSDALRAQLLSQINAERQSRGLGRLVLNKGLNKAAQGHACDMAAKGYFSHTSKGGGTLKRRLNRVGYAPCLAAENIYKSNIIDVARVRDKWMQSQGHRKNILLNGVDEVGLGVAVPRKGGWAHWVMVVGTRCQ